MRNWNCTYTRTISGSCDQQKSRGREQCYYHVKVVDKLIEADEESALREMPTISTG